MGYMNQVWHDLHNGLILVMCILEFTLLFSVYVLLFHKKILFFNNQKVKRRAYFHDI